MSAHLCSYSEGQYKLYEPSLLHVTLAYLSAFVALEQSFVHECNYFVQVPEKSLDSVQRRGRGCTRGRESQFDMQ